MLDNKKIAQIFSQMADILEIKDANPFRVNAYRQASHSLENLAENVHQTAKKDKLEKIPKVGKGLAQHIKDLIATGTCPEFEELKKDVPLKVLKLLEIEGIGPKKLKFLYHKFGINSLYKLEKLLKSKKLYSEEGWGEKSAQNLIKAINLYKKFNKRFLLGAIYPLVQEIKQELKKSKFVDQIEVCGSIRRWKETVGDIDILITSQKPEKVIKLFTTLKYIKRILAKGPTKVQVVLEQGIDADLRVVKPDSFGAAVHYFTGSKAHNIQIRKLGLKKNLRLNEYGVFRKKGKKLRKIKGKKEKDVFQAVGLPWITPELREDQGEIKAGLKNKLPHLITLKDIKGDCHMHTVWSDGFKTIKKMAQASKRLGYEYIAITDHATPLGVAHGLGPKRIPGYLKAIEKANKEIKGIKILAGIEIDIKKDGSLYLADKILKKFDLVIAAVHSALKMDEKTMTQRVCQAISNPYVHVLAHPFGRLLNKREPYSLNLEKLLQQAQKTKTILEINAFVRRLDLNPSQARLAKQKGVKMIISTDSHHYQYLDVMQYGVALARRGWLEKKDVVNTLSLKKFLKILKNKNE